MPAFIETHSLRWLLLLPLASTLSPTHYHVALPIPSAATAAVCPEDGRKAAAMKGAGHLSSQLRAVQSDAAEIISF